MQYNILDILHRKVLKKMDELKEYKRHKKICDMLCGLCLLIFVAGIVIFIWFGIVGLKIMATSFVLMIFFSLYSKVVNERIVQIMKKESNS